MAGLVFSSADSHPELLLGGGGSSGSNLSVPPQEVPHQGAEVSASPLGKGVGVFGLIASPSENGITMDDQIKDPKVNRMFPIWDWDPVIACVYYTCPGYRSYSLWHPPQRSLIYC